MFVHKGEHFGQALFGGLAEEVDVETVSVALSRADESVGPLANLGTTP